MILKIENILQKRKYYAYVFLCLCIALSASYVSIRIKTSTAGITVNESVMTCENTIKVKIEKSIAGLQPSLSSLNFESQICSYDLAFNSGDKDRAYLFELAQKMDFWLFDRPDLAQYFYRRIVNANPDDALSVYILQEKIKDH